jgi:hypothetical protein
MHRGAKWCDLVQLPFWKGNDMKLPLAILAVALAALVFVSASEAHGVRRGNTVVRAPGVTVVTQRRGLFGLRSSTTVVDQFGNVTRVRN